ncbi:hypothetical protein K4K54_005878 [Colletotrichum sp. SAR 10_86]|nr:hypothetical protein K4K50_011481 [Colletotrichum sp. SAR 10_71]KAI8206555.1 hypothetical protein KHU50_012856 [Colletotrichum sp. SAR 10_65]KAI8214856.1 hypothetical protein K4K52_012417 [Colletotrichum sp. SAR 10_76]KAI8238109.1 hypothetical protein K4K54_005878 [Colletotrichum sp. SAR 10_86]KAI8263104.1 hypothetical protein K4K53_009549 [Colletotrichum sp. SAR 10_77]KAI8268164.1 hypothetical protein K4K58_005921 [Colletotrichum sp. SAR11_239]KAI8285461.1 hypothetical protein K4K56_00929
MAEIVKREEQNAKTNPDAVKAAAAANGPPNANALPIDPNQLLSMPKGAGGTPTAVVLLGVFGGVAGVSLLAMGVFIYGLMRRKKQKAEAETASVSSLQIGRPMPN